MQEAIKQYSIRVMIMVIMTVILYFVTSLAEGKLDYRDWSSVGSTVFYILSLVCIVHLLTSEFPKDNP